jgi:hypothetical protein
VRGSVGHEIAQLAHEDDPLNVVRALEKEEFLKVLHPHWTTAKVDANGLSHLMKTRQQLVDLGYTVDASAAVMHFLTAHLPEKDISDLRRQMPRKDLVDAWRNLEDEAKELAKRLSGKEAATPSKTWNLLSAARPEMVLFLAVTARQQAVETKIKNFLTKWRQVQQRIPLPEMTELLITPQLPEYPKIARDVFMLLLDGRLRSRNETLKFLKPFAPPPPPPPPPPRRGRGPKAAVVAAPVEVPVVAGKKGKGKKTEALIAGPVAMPPAKGKAGTSPAPLPPAKAAAPPAKPAAKPVKVPAKAVSKKLPAKPAAKKAAKKPAAKAAAKSPAKKASGKKPLKKKGKKR